MHAYVYIPKLHGQFDHSCHKIFSFNYLCINTKCFQTLPNIQCPICII